jgi:hypothetical protein
MPFAIEITVNVLWILLACVLSLLAGVSFRTFQLNKAKRKVFELERQCIQTDAEILELHKEVGQLLNQLKNNPVPVIPITAKENPDNLPDTSNRKKLLSKSGTKQPS